MEKLKIKAYMLLKALTATLAISRECARHGEERTREAQGHEKSKGMMETT